MPRVLKLAVVRNDRAKKKAKDVRGKFFREARAAVHIHGEDIRGFAFVIWDRRGMATTEVFPGEGTLIGSQIPTYVQNVLTQHVASMLVDTTPAPQDDQ